MASVLRVHYNCSLGMLHTDYNCNRVLSVTYWLQLQSCPVCYILTTTASCPVCYILTTTAVVSCLLHTDYNSVTYWLQRSWPVCYILTPTVVACLLAEQITLFTTGRTCFFVFFPQLTVFGHRHGESASTWIGLSESSVQQRNTEYWRL